MTARQPPGATGQQRAAPHRTLLFRLIAFFSHVQLGYLVQDGRHSTVAVRIFVFFEGATSIAIIGIVAYFIDLPLLFPPLGPSAFVLFYTPLARAAAPRSVILAHGLALLVGLSLAGLFELLSPHGLAADGDRLDWIGIVTLSLSMGLTGFGMILLRCPHPPAAATALIAAMGFFETPTQVTGFIVALALLLLQAFVFNRVLGGLPFPPWRFSPGQTLKYPELAGLADREMTVKDKLHKHIYARRR